ncbi:hypothetical protein [Streptomyces sp. NPDC046161]|uniref:hypothetical protein n=1 Tax=Streptomyces sp. NPDC046161 TaxID=3155132 RepID=UPI00340B888C
MQAEQSVPEPSEDAGNATESDTPEFPPKSSGTPDTAVAVAGTPPRRRGSTSLLIAAGLVLGAVAGTATGYVVQYDREPTPLPPLAQQSIDTPAPLAPNAATTRRSIDANRWTKAEEDIDKMLVDAPSGADVAFSGAQSADEYAAGYYDKPSEGIGSLLRDRVRRNASSQWKDGRGTYVEIRLSQYRDRMGAANFQRSMDYMAWADHAGNGGKDLPGVPKDFGHMWIYSKSGQARVVARRGDIVMDIIYTNADGKVDEGALLDLAKRQWERL